MTTEPPLVYILDLVGTAGFAFSGLLRGLHRRPDLIGMTVLATATAVGGGIVRDVVLARPVTMLSDMNYLVVILGTVLVACLFPARLLRREKFFMYFDAVGLGVFSAIGASLAFDQGLNPLSVVFVAGITGAGGGIIRDVLLGEMPLVLYREVYISAVIAGSAALLAVRYAGLDHAAGFLAALLVTTAIRILAIRLGWTLPRIGQL